MRCNFRCHETIRNNSNISYSWNIGYKYIRVFLYKFSLDNIMQNMSDQISNRNIEGNVRTMVTSGSQRTYKTPTISSTYQVNLM